MAILRAERALLRNRRLTLLTASRTVSVLGNGFGQVALAFGVLALPGASVTRLSLVQAALAVPQLLVLVGGVVADRLSRARLMVCAETVAGTAYAGLAVMLLTRHAPTWGLCALAIVAGLGTALFSPAYNGVVPQVVPAADLQAANGLQRLGMNGGRILGYALAGGCVALFGAGWGLAIDAASFLVSAGLIALIRVPERAARAPSHPLRDLREGWREFRSRQWLWVIVAQFSLVVAVFAAQLGVLGPLAARQDLGGATAWSAVMTAQMAGTLVGVVLAVRLRPARPMLVATLATLVFALPCLALGLGAPLWVVLAASFADGVANDVFGVLWTTTLQREIPDEVISRVSAWDIFGSLAVAPLGVLVAGPVAVAAGVHAALLGGAALTVLVTLAALVAPGVRGLRAPAPSPTVTPPVAESA